MQEMLLANTPLAFIFWGVFGYVFATLVLRPLFVGKREEDSE